MRVVRVDLGTSCSRVAESILLGGRGEPIDVGTQPVRQREPKAVGDPHVLGDGGPQRCVERGRIGDVGVGDRPARFGELREQRARGRRRARDRAAATTREPASTPTAPTTAATEVITARSMREP